jgi:hypothetical protein
MSKTITLTRGYEANVAAKKYFGDCAKINEISK